MGELKLYSESAEARVKRDRKKQPNSGAVTAGRENDLGRVDSQLVVVGICRPEV